MKFLIILIALFFVIFLLEKLLGIKREKISETPGKNMERWGRAIILAVFLAAYVFALINGTDIILKWWWPLFCIALFGFQALLEWKYLKKSKQYIATLIGSAVIISAYLAVTQFYS